MLHRLGRPIHYLGDRQLRRPNFGLPGAQPPKGKPNRGRGSLTGSVPSTRSHASSATLQTDTHVEDRLTYVVALSTEAIT